MKVFGLIALLVITSAMNFETFEPEPYQMFFKGLFMGLGKAGDECNKESNAMSHQFGLLYQDILNYANTNNYLPVLGDLMTLKSEVKSAIEACDLSGLLKKLSKLLGPSGKATIMKNYFLHTSAINTNIAVIENCSENFYDCGLSFGNIIKLMSGWSLGSALEESTDNNEVNFEATDFFDLAESLFKTIEWDAPDFCDEMFNMLPTYKQIAQQLTGTLTGNVQDAKDLVSSLLHIWVEEAVVSDCALNYGGMILYVFPNIISNTHTWRLAYYAETSNFMNNVNYITASCSKNYSTCGVKIGNIVNLLLKYTNGL